MILWYMYSHHYLTVIPQVLSSFFITVPSPLDSPPRHRPSDKVSCYRIFWDLLNVYNSETQMLYDYDYESIMRFIWLMICEIIMWLMIWDYLRLILKSLLFFIWDGRKQDKIYENSDVNKAPGFDRHTNQCWLYPQLLLDTLCCWLYPAHSCTNAGYNSHVSWLSC